MSAYRTRYFVTYPGAAETEVNLAAWCLAERAAGFTGPAGHAATGGFGGHGIEGRITYGLEDETPEPARAPAAGELELELEGTIPENGWDELQDAADLASDQDQLTWIVRGGRRIAAIVPVDVAEYHEQLVASALPVIQHHRQPHGETTELLIPRGHLALFPGQVQLRADRLRELLPDIPIVRNIAPGHELMRQILREAPGPVTNRDLVIALAEHGISVSRGTSYGWLQADIAAGLVKARGREEDGQPSWRYTWTGEEPS